MINPYIAHALSDQINQITGQTEECSQKKNHRSRTGQISTPPSHNVTGQSSTPPSHNVTGQSSTPPSPNVIEHMSTPPSHNVTGQSSTPPSHNVTRVVVKYRYLYLYLSTMLSVLDVLEYLIGENAKYLYLYLIQSTWSNQVLFKYSGTSHLYKSIVDYSGNYSQQ